MPWNFVPPSGWSDFLSNYSAIQSLNIPKNLQPYANRLLATGRTFISQSNSGTTIQDADIEEWLYEAQNLASRLHNSSMAASTAAGQNRPSGIAADADRYYDTNTGTNAFEYMDSPLYSAAGSQPEYGVTAPYFGLTSPQMGDWISTIETIAVWGIGIIGAIVLLPPVLRAITRR